MTWTANTSAGAERVTFRGEGLGNVGRVFRGTTTNEMWAAFRSMTVPSMRSRVRPGWRVETPSAYLSYGNDGAKRRFVVFHSPTTTTPLVLRFEREVTEPLLVAIAEAFTTKNKHEEAPDGEERGSECTEADRQVESPAGSASEPEPGRDRRGRPSAEDSGRHAEGEQVGPAGTWWKRNGKGRTRKQPAGGGAVASVSAAAPSEKGSEDA